VIKELAFKLFTYLFFDYFVNIFFVFWSQISRETTGVDGVFV